MAAVNVRERRCAGSREEETLGFSYSLCGSSRELRPPFTYLLPPHRVIQTSVGEQFVVAPILRDAAAFEHVDAVSMKHRGKAVRDQNRDRFATAGNVANGLADFLLGDG